MASDGQDIKGTPAHPKKELWDWLYQNQKDNWTTAAADKELLKFVDVLTNGKKGLKTLVPMCGKTQVMLTLAEQGHSVTGIEWSELAVKQFFEGNNLQYDTKPYIAGGVEMPVYVAKDKAITIYCGDIFAFKEDNLGGFDCILDHGAIGCFDATEISRARYGELMTSFTKPGGRMLLSIFDYEHSEHPSIPFAVTEEEVATIYKSSFSPPKVLQEMDTQKMEETFRFREIPDTLFRIWELSRFSWKVLLLVKNWT